MYEKTKKSWMKHFDFLIIDLLCIEIAYAFSFELRYLWFHKSVESFWQLNPLSNALHRQVAILLAVFHILFALLRSVYKNILRRGYYEEAKNVVMHNAVVFVALSIFLYATKAAVDFSRASFFFTWIASCVLMYIAHELWKNLVRHRMENDSRLPGVLIVASANRAEKIIKELSAHRYNGFRVVGIVALDENLVGQVVQGIPVVAEETTMYNYVLDHVVDAILISEDTNDLRQRQYVERFLSMGQTIHIDLNRNDADYPNKIVQRFGNLTVLTSSIKSVDGYQLAAKRIMDILGGIIGCIVTLIVAVILFPIVKIQAPGPLFFTQTRIGRNGRKFKIYKFRSMYVDAEARKTELMDQNEMQGLMFKMENDPRIFPAGHFIRRYSIDELPQFFNVLKGDMSLVGTRPPTVEEYERYELHHRIRLSIKPGISGLWQVSGRNNIKNFEQVVQLDEQYIREWNLGLDIKILLKTIKVVLGGEGAM